MKIRFRFRPLIAIPQESADFHMKRDSYSHNVLVSGYYPVKYTPWD